MILLIPAPLSFNNGRSIEFTINRSISTYFKTLAKERERKTEGERNRQTERERETDKTET